MLSNKNLPVLTHNFFLKLELLNNDIYCKIGQAMTSV